MRNLMKTKNVDINTIIPYARNPRNNENAIDGVVASLKEFGFQQPIVVDKENVVIVGHTRLLAAKRVNYDEVPIVVADLTDAQAKAYRIADNKLNQNALWDNELLKLEFEEIPPELLNVTGFDINELNLLHEGWDSDQDRFDNMESIDGVDKDRVLIRCKHEDKETLLGHLEPFLKTLELEGLDIQ